MCNNLFLMLVSLLFAMIQQTEKLIYSDIDKCLFMCISVKIVTDIIIACSSNSLINLANNYTLHFFPNSYAMLCYFRNSDPVTLKRLYYQSTAQSFRINDTVGFSFTSEPLLLIILAIQNISVELEASRLSPCDLFFFEHYYCFN